jgi:glycogen operon protein
LGNNNAYCQDNEISWIDWNLDRSKLELLEFTRHLIRLFHQHPVLRRRKFFQGRKIRGAEIKDIAWFRPDGKEMTEADWRNAVARSLGVRLAGDAINEVDERGNRIVGDTLLILFNAHHEFVSFELPAHRRGVRWEQVLDTREPTGRRKNRRLVKGGGIYRMDARSLALFRLRTEGDDAEGGTQNEEL